jgi:hypothetical protein
MISGGISPSTGCQSKSELLYAIQTAYTVTDFILQRQGLTDMKYPHAFKPICIARYSSVYHARERDANYTMNCRWDRQDRMQARNSDVALDSLQGDSKVAVDAVDGRVGADGDQLLGALCA